MPDSINLNELSKGKKFALTVESDTPKDADARRTDKTEEAKHRRRIHFCIIILALVLILVSVVFLGYILLTGSADDKKWATAIATAIVTSIVSGLVGHAIPQSSD